MIWIYLVMGFIILLTVLRIRKRKYFWKTRAGEKIDSKEFGKRWIKGVQGVTPLQQTKVMLWSFIPLIIGIIWGIVITAIAKTYWMTLILCGSLPLTLINIFGTYQKFIALKKIDGLMKEVNKNE